MLEAAARANETLTAEGTLAQGVGGVDVTVRSGNELRTLMYGAEAMTYQNALADRVAADVLAVVTARPDVKVHCVQDAAAACAAGGTHSSTSFRQIVRRHRVPLPLLPRLSR